LPVQLVALKGGIMKKYTKPVILSQEVLEKTALECSYYAYYTNAGEVCYDTYLGAGKNTTVCAAGAS
jgi:hypothetical protein